MAEDFADLDLDERLKAVREKLRDCLEEIDALGLPFVGNHISMAIETIPDQPGPDQLGATSPK